jgi:hypothetical protein
MRAGVLRDGALASTAKSCNAAVCAKLGNALAFA